MEFLVEISNMQYGRSDTFSNNFQKEKKKKREKFRILGSNPKEKRLTEKYRYTKQKSCSKQKFL